MQTESRKWEAAAAQGVRAWTVATLRANQRSGCDSDEKTEKIVAEQLVEAGAVIERHRHQYPHPQRW